MGNYVYKIKTTNTITVEGLAEQLTVHCAEYAYKPYYLGQWRSTRSGGRYVEPEEINRKMHFSTGAQACDNAWKRRGDRPEYVTLENAESIKEAYRFDDSYQGYGTGAEIYFYDRHNPAGHFNDGRDIGWPVGWVYWSEHDQQFILQYRQLDAFEDDPRHAA